MSTSRRRNRSPSKRNLSSIDRRDDRDLGNDGRNDNKEGDDGLTITPDEIDEIIVKWHQAKEEAGYLREKETKYKKLLNRVMDLTGGDVIKGKDYKVVRRFQKRKCLVRDNIPKEIYEKYCTVKEIRMLYLKEL